MPLLRDKFINVVLFLLDMGPNVTDSQGIRHILRKVIVKT